MKRHVYLTMKSLEEAKHIFFSKFPPDKRTSSIEVLTTDALGRVTSEPVFARISVPNWHLSAMDGVAVRAEDTYGATEREPRILKIGTHAEWINTGQLLPDGYNAVIMIEKIHQIDEESIEIRAPAYPWQNVRKVGEDIVSSQILYPRDHRIRSCDIGALLSAGVFKIKVWKIPRVVVIPTGSELVDFRSLKEPERLKKSEIIDSNSHMICSMVREAGAVPEVYPIVEDEPSTIREAIKRAVESRPELVIINAGSSAGSRDYTADIIEEMGEVFVHGIAMMPGKPTILGEIKGVPVVGNPGYPVSSIISFEQLLRPYLLSIQGIKPAPQKVINVIPVRDIPSRLGIEEFVRVNIGRVGQNTVAVPLARAAGSISTIIRAEGIIRIDSFTEGIKEGEEIHAQLLVDESDIENTVVIIGSHDISIDILSNEIRKRGYSIRIASGNVGSLGGLIALRKGACHIAGSHLLDTDTGEYNISYIKRYLKGIKVSLIHLAMREQGLIVQKGNPKGIQGIKDLIRDDIIFVNRQRGSGTRILLDYELERLGIDKDRISGYEIEEYTHMAVAVDVKSGVADCGLGIYASAKALDLDFIPVTKEQYDLVIPSSFINMDSIKIVLDTISSEDFREQLISLGGYDPKKSGELIAEINS